MLDEGMRWVAVLVPWAPVLLPVGLAVAGVAWMLSAIGPPERDPQAALRATIYEAAATMDEATAWITQARIANFWTEVYIVTLLMGYDHIGEAGERVANEGYAEERGLANYVRYLAGDRLNGRGRIE